MAGLCVKHGRPDDGLAWAERGLEAYGTNVDSSLLGFCIDTYLHGGKFDRADALAWRRFETHPTAELLSALLTVASATGRQDDTRERALKHLWSRVTDEALAAKTKHSYSQPHARTELVTIFLAENANDVA